jgi:Sec-independent protein translocase protein TatA
MLGISFSELFIVLLVAFFVMKPKDIRKLAYWYKYILKKVVEIRSIAQESIDEINESLVGKKKPGAKQEYAVDSERRLRKTLYVDPLKRKKPKGEKL